MIVILYILTFEEIGKDGFNTDVVVAIIIVGSGSGRKGSHDDLKTE